MNTTELLQKLQARNVKLMGGDANQGRIFSLSELQILMAYLLDGTMTPAQMKEFIESKVN